MMTEHATTAPTSAVERTLVARGWADIDLVERMGSGATRRHRTATLSSDHDRARSWYEAPVADHVPPRLKAMYESEANVTRYRRVCDFLTEGEKVYEVGLGYGFLGVMMMRGGKLGRYHGVDLLDSYVTHTRETLRANGFEGQATVAQKNLYDVTRADIEAAEASLLVCCEVIEHVPDPELALKTLAEALPAGTDLLFSVPLIGRLEGVWGHGQIFGVARIQEMLRGAGLVAHHVEVLHDTWALILASAGTEPSPRAAAILEATAEVDSSRWLKPPFEAMVNTPVNELTRAESTQTKRVSDVEVSAPAKRAEGLRLTAQPKRVASGPGAAWSAHAGLAFQVPEGCKGVRLEVNFADWDDVAAMSVEFRRDGERIGLWKLKPAERRPKSASPTFLMAPGREGQNLRRTPRSSSEGADTVEVFVTGVGNQPIDFSILRWAWVS